MVDLFTITGPKVYCQKDLKNILDDHRDQWHLAEEIGLQHFIKFAAKFVSLQPIKLSFPNRNEIRYIYGECSIHTIVQSLRPKGYFSHRSAAEIHGLLDPNDQIFFNFEQSLRSQSLGEMTQDAIDRTFHNRARITQNKARYNDYTIWLLNGKNTDYYGVIQHDEGNNKSIRVTDIARTLIDMAVRPDYSGGPVQILQAYRKGLGVVDGHTLIKALVNLKHNYPYHQVVGFYMEKAGFNTEHLEPLRMLPMNFDFYLDYQMVDPLYSPTWRLYYPLFFG